jgi:hypothetical protein
MRESTLLHAAIVAFRDSTGQQLTVNSREWQPAGHLLDALLELDFGDRQLRFVVECKKNVDRSTLLSQIKTALDEYQHQGLPLLVTQHMTATMADQCKQLGLNFIDTAGNGYVQANGFFVFVKGNKAKNGTQATSDYRGGTSAGSLRMVFALVCRPELLSAPYRDIVDAAGVSLGAVGWIFHDLEARGLITSRDSKKQRHFIDLPRLREEWAVNYPHKLKPRLKPRKFSTENTEWWKHVEPTANFLWGGEIAAARLDHYLKPTTQTLYVKHGTASSTINQLAHKHRFRSDPHGPIEVLESFWNFDDNYTQQQVVPPLLIYSDLIATLDPRAVEAAILLKKNHIDPSP